MKKSYFLSSIIGMCAIACTASAAEVLTESFEGFADQAALNASWSIGGTNIQLKTDGGHTGNNYIRHPIATFRQGRGITSVTPTDAAPLVIECWIRPVTGTTSAADGRGVAGLGNGTTTISPIVEMGNYNALSPDDNGFEARIVGGTPTPASWAAIGGTRTLNGWSKLKAVIKSKDVNFYVDDVLATTTFSRTASNFGAINQVYLGVNAATSVETDFDDFHIYTDTADVNDWNLY